MEPKTDEAELLPDLEPLEGDETAQEVTYADLLSSFDDDEDDEDDEALGDSTATDLDPGIAFADDDAPDLGGPDPGLDVGEMMGDALGDEEGSAEGDAVGPIDHDAAGDITETFGESLDDDLEGATQPEDLLDEELPRLVVSPDDQEEGAADDELPTLSTEGDEDPPAHAELPWSAVPLPRSTLPHQVVRMAGVRLLAGGTDLIRVEPDDAIETLSGGLGGKVTGLVVDGDQRALVVATSTGDLFRLIPGGAAPESLATWRTAGQLGGAKDTTLTLGGPTPSSRPALLLLANVRGGTLLESTDHGTTWRRVELGGSVLALSAGTPPVCIVETEAGVRLFRSESSGGFRAAATEWPLDGEGLVMESDGDVVAALEPGRGVHVSADGGVTLRRVSGTSRATAVTVGRLGGRSSAFAALFDAGSGRTSLVWIDATSGDARIVAELSPRSEDDEDDFTRAASLSWDPHTETLWAAGAFGLARFRRPPSA